MRYKQIILLAVAATVAWLIFSAVMLAAPPASSTDSPAPFSTAEPNPAEPAD